MGSWALISFQATFYARVYELAPDVYAPALATILPIGGIVGGVGGGLLADWLSKIGGRAWLTAGAHGCRPRLRPCGAVTLVPGRMLSMPAGAPGSLPVWTLGLLLRRLSTCACNWPPRRPTVELPNGRPVGSWLLRVDGHACLPAGAASPCCSS